MISEKTVGGVAETRFAPNPGPQTDFLASPADIAIYGGAAGGGKSFALLYEPIRHLENPRFGGVIFRRTFPQITMEGGLWDESEVLYRLLDGVPNQTKLSWSFPSGASISFAHMQHESDRYDYQGSQIAFIAFDELTHFTEAQFWYLVSRNRSTSGVSPYIRASTNPDSMSWVRTFLDWWVDEDTGFPIPERAGVIRFMARKGNEILWGDSREEVYAKAKALLEPAVKQGATLADLIKSVTFVPAKLSDNPEMSRKNPGYIGSLLSQTIVERARLLDGNWNIRNEAGNFFRREWFQIVEAAPAGDLQRVRYWDRAGTKDGGDFTVGCLMSRSADGLITVEDIVRGQWNPGEVLRAIQATASRDGVRTTIWLEQEPGSSGVADVQHLIRSLAGFNAWPDKKTGSKADMANPFSAQASNGNVRLVRGSWNEAFLRELEDFDGTGKGTDDQVDASSGAFSKLNQGTATLSIH